MTQAELSSRRRYLKRHCVGCERLQPLKLRSLDAGTGPAGIDQPAIGIVVGEQQRAEIGPASFGIGLADHHEFLAVQTFDLAPEAAVAGDVRSMFAF